MERVMIQSCADAGNKYCPCHLAYSGDCIKCSLIKGRKTCDCLWQGICIYNEIVHNKDAQILEREEYLCNISTIKEIGENIYLIKIKAPKIMIKDLCSPGAYVLLKSRDKNSAIFNTPISVMDVDMENSILEVVIKPRGIKTKFLLDYNEVWVKGPYFNGVFGIKDLKCLRKLNCVVILNGLSQVNSLNIIRRLLVNENHVEVFFNNRSIILDEVQMKIRDLGVNTHMIDMEEGKDFIVDYIKRNNVEFVYSGGGNQFNKYVMNIVDIVSKDIKLAISNNNLICCGEGICGSCTVNLNGERVKSCKSQLDSRAFLQTV